MFCNVNGLWIILVFFIKILKPVNLQFGVPIYGPPMFPPPAPMFPVPPPMPLMAPAVVPAAVPSSSSSSSSEENNNTKTKRSKKKKRSMLFPAFPSFVRRPPCPPCMCVPSCTPSFFSYCSPCHKKCRCKKRKDSSSNESDSSYDVPVPMPPIIAPQPLVLVPVPPAIPARPIPPRRRPRKKLLPIYSSDDSTDTSSSSEYIRDRRYRKRRRPRIYRRNLRSSESDNELLKPMLSYIADNGDVKFETKINNDDVAELLGKKPKVNKQLQTVQILSKTDETNKPEVVVISKDKETRRNKPGRHKQVLLRGGLSKHMLGEGKKELIFRPPADKKISNLSVSFNIS